MTTPLLLPDTFLAAAAGLLAKVTFILLLAFTLNLLLRRRSAALRAFIWNAAVVAAVLLPLAALATPHWHPRFDSPELTPELVRREAVKADSAAAVLAAGSRLSARPGRMVTPLEHAHLAGPLQQHGRATTSASGQPSTRIVTSWLAVVWIAGALLALALCAVRLTRQHALRNTMRPVAASEPNRMLLRYAGMLGIRRPVALFVSAHLSVPVALGILRPGVALPAAALRWPQEQLRSVMLHEMAHLQRLDPLWLLLTQIMLALYWWHPLAWFASRRSYLETELACDDAVLRHGSAAGRYAAHLVSVARSAIAGTPPFGYHVAMAGSRCLDTRVRALFDRSVRRGSLRPRTTVLLSLLAATALGGMAGCELRSTENMNVVQNTTRAWGNAAAVRLEKVREYGSRDETDNNFILHLPRDVQVDSHGNTFIFDFGSRRIQKYSPEGVYLQTIGRAGEGPGELDNPWSFGLDAEDRVLVLTQTHLQIFDPSGNEVARNNFDTPIQDAYIGFDGTMIVQLPNGLWQDRPGFDVEAEAAQPLVNIFDLNGRLLRTLGATERFDFDGKTGVIRSVFMDRDSRNNIWLSHGYANRVEKYSPEGNLLVAADYTLSVEQFMNIDEQPDFWVYQLGKVSEAVQVDAKDRVWVQSYREQITWSLYSSRSKWDRPYFVLNVFDSSGVLQGTLPIDEVFYDFRIFGDRLFLVDRMGMMTVTDYRIVEQ
jgi:beta-lactamase regulating signal transducer with metallopeptidase domain